MSNFDERATKIGSTWHQIGLQQKTLQFCGCLLQAGLEQMGSVVGLLLNSFWFVTLSSITDLHDPAYL